MSAPQHRSSATLFALVYAALVVYASLYPFEDWRAADEGLFSFLLLPWPRWWTGFDLAANLLGYIPIGALIFGAFVRHGEGLRRSAAIAWGVSIFLSLCMETMQNIVARRVASNVDLSFNALGAAIGIALAIAIHKLGWVGRWQSVRERWFVAQSAGGLAWDRGRVDAIARGLILLGAVVAHYYCGHRIRPRLRPPGKIYQGHQRGLKPAGGLFCYWESLCQRT